MSSAGPAVPLAHAAHFAGWGRGVMRLASGDPDAADAHAMQEIERVGESARRVVGDPATRFGAGNRLAPYVFPVAHGAFLATETGKTANAQDTLASAIFFLRRLTDPSVADWTPDADDRAQLLPCAVALQSVLDDYERTSPTPHASIVAARAGAAVVLRRLLVPPGAAAAVPLGFVAVALGAGAP